jgi:hypothetical protein
VPIRSRTADEVDMTTDSTDELIAEDGGAPVGGTPVDGPPVDGTPVDGPSVDEAHATALDAVARIHDAALAAIADLAATWETAGDDVRVVRLAERPTVALRIEAVAA